MHYYIYCNQKKISSFHQEAISEYTKRLSPYCDMHFILSPKEFVPDNFTESNHAIIILKRAASTFSSEEFASYLQKYELSGKSNLHIYAGYTEDEIYSAFSSQNRIPTLSITKSGLSNETVCTLLYEQIYRAYTILQGKTYHK